MKQATVATTKIVVEAARIVEAAHAHVDLMNESYQIELNKLANVSLNGNLTGECVQYCPYICTIRQILELD